MAASALVVGGVLMLDLTGVIGDDGDDEPAEEVATVEETTTTTIPPPPACAEADVVVTGDPTAEWATTLVDTARSLPPEFGPADLHNIADAGFPLTDGLAVREVLLADLDALRQAAAANATPISVLAGYRSYSQQGELFDRRVEELGGNEAGSRVARPGHSEHQLGTTIDVTTEGAVDVDQAWGATPMASGWRPTPTSSASCSAIPPTRRTSPATTTSPGTCATWGGSWRPT